MKSVQAIIRGRVQGVGFRHFARECALRHGVRGFVRNAADGSVEVRAEGDSAAITRFMDAIRIGPSFAEVSSVDVLPAEHKGFETFEIR